ncbi:PEP-CTERM sorting domain-containing protein [Microcystis flos-aquae]|uniref:PEP-CTERM sorting domain-containing protein n=1 Tax=Microcystis flos-aquae TaxID=109615 RepID=UPI001F54F937|nr:PEP-CTERM sorting domain-containing protein [Microcystis flos-aquae]
MSKKLAINIFASSLILYSLSLCISEESKAGYIGSIIRTDTKPLFKADLFWDLNPQNGGGDTIGFHWSVTAREQTQGKINFPVDLGGSYGNNIFVSDIKHNIAPHDEPTNLTGLQFGLNRVLPSQVQLTDPHEPTNHLDLFKFSYKKFNPGDFTDASFDIKNKSGWVLSVNFTHVPEPSTILSLLALGTLGAASTLKRKLKPSQSTEKETTKVS